MLLRAVIGLFVISSLLSCRKQSITTPYSFLNLRIEGQDEPIIWETITSKWIDTIGSADIEATSYYFDRCTIHLKNIIGTSSINSVTLQQFYYTDGLDFNPYAISGALTIVQADGKAIKGMFSLYLESNYNGFAGKNITGDFGIINK